MLQSVSPRLAPHTQYLSSKHCVVAYDNDIAQEMKEKKKVDKFSSRVEHFCTGHAKKLFF
jgi:hypothetical protein